MNLAHARSLKQALLAILIVTALTGCKSNSMYKSTSECVDDQIYQGVDGYKAWAACKIYDREGN